MLHPLEGAAGLDAGDAARPGQVFLEESLAGGEVGDRDAEQVVGVVGHTQLSR